MRRSTLVVLPVVLSIVGAWPTPAWAAKRPTDTTAPSLSVATPTSGASVSSPFLATGSAADNRSLAKVTVSLDGGAATTATGTSSWSWSSSALAPGSHSITVTAYDASSNTTSTSVRVAVQAPSDTTAPTITIATPSASSTVSGVFQATGTAGDDTSVSSVHVKVDNGPPQLANGTSNWSLGLDATSWTSGNHTITAEAVDAALNWKSTSTVVTVAAPATSTTSGPDITLTDPKASHPLALFGRGRMAHLDSLTAVPYGEQYTSRVAVFLRDTISGASSYVDLPTNNPNGWQNTYVAFTSRSDLWALSGSGPVYLRHYAFVGSPLATTATLVSEQALGDADSRSGDLIRLQSGALVAVWHQQGVAGPDGLSVGYLSPSGTWSQLPELTFMSTASSKQILVQHPADGSIWLFNDPDAWASTGAVHLTESPSGLSVDWTNDRYLSRNALGPVGPSGENPDLAVAADPQAGTIDLAFESDDYRYFSDSPIVKGAYVTVSRVPATGPCSFVVLPTYVERITALSLSVVGGNLWLGYRPVDPATLTWDHLYVSRYSGGAWGLAAPLGQVASPYQPLAYTSDAPYLASRMADGAIHLHTVA